ncbi:hypothetical protein BaRGS_00004109 [Batillaria attramentaria]|uniref:Uncharacterized protein n=1 Tax=Batillaria attramentaria TaxID=370345 RepID=A0ABD0LYU4_9CAEN
MLTPVFGTRRNKRKAKGRKTERKPKLPGNTVSFRWKLEMLNNTSSLTKDARTPSTRKLSVRRQAPADKVKGNPKPHYHQKHGPKPRALSKETPDLSARRP